MNKILIATTLAFSILVTPLFAAAANDARPAPNQQQTQCVTLEQDAVQFSANAKEQNVKNYIGYGWKGDFLANDHPFDTLWVWEFNVGPGPGHGYFMIFFKDGCRIRAEGPLPQDQYEEAMKKLGFTKSE